MLQYINNAMDMTRIGMKTNDKHLTSLEGTIEKCTQIQSLRFDSLKKLEVFSKTKNYFICKKKQSSSIKQILRNMFFVKLICRVSGEELNTQGSNLLAEGSKILDDAKNFFANLDGTFEKMKTTGVQLVS